MTKKQTTNYANYVSIRKRRGNIEIYARVGYYDDSGVWREKTKRAESEEHARQLAQEILSNLEQRGNAYIDSAKLTFEKFAAWYEDDHLIAPIYVGGAKIEGLRSWKALRNQLKNLVKYFGSTLITEITFERLKQFKRKRLNTDKVQIATVNRDLSLLRAMFKKAFRRKWISENPFDLDENLIETSLETRRNFVLTDEQEIRLLKACADLKTTSPRLFALVIALRDTGARPSELYPVNDNNEDYGVEKQNFFEPIRWRDVLDDSGEVKDVTRLVSYKGKRREERIAFITERLKVALLDLWKFLKQGELHSIEEKRVIVSRRASLDNLIFPHKSYLKGWGYARTLAGLPDLRLRDLRRDFSSRLAKLGFSDRLAQKLLGHKNLQQTFYYTELDLESVLQAKMLLDTANQKVFSAETTDFSKPENLSD